MPTLFDFLKGPSVKELQDTNKKLKAEIEALGIGCAYCGSLLTKERRRQKAKYCDTHCRRAAMRKQREQAQP